MTYYWLIEARRSDGQELATPGYVTDKNGQFAIVFDPNAAWKFETKAEAEASLAKMREANPGNKGLELMVVTEHGFMDASLH